MKETNNEEEESFGELSISLKIACRAQRNANEKIHWGNEWEKTHRN